MLEQNDPDTPHETVISNEQSLPATHAHSSPEGPDQTTISDGQSLPVQNADHVFAAVNFKQTNIYYGGTADNGQPCSPDGADWGVELASETHACRWTQTRILEREGTHGQGNVYVCRNFRQVNLYINEEAARVLAENGYDTKKLKKSVSKWLSRVHWNGPEISSGVLTAFKMTMKNGMEMLLKEVVDMHRLGLSHEKYCHVIEETFQHGMKLMGLDFGSLVFTFEHETEGDTEHVLSSVENQRTIQEILLRFLPSWVKAEDIQWEVLPCRSVPEECQLSEPITVFSQESNKLTSEESHMEQVIKRTLEQYKSSICQDLIRAQEQSFQQLAEKHIADLSQKVQTLLAGYTSQGLGATRPLAEEASGTLRQCSVTEDGGDSINAWFPHKPFSDTPSNRMMDYNTRLSEQNDKSYMEGFGHKANNDKTFEAGPHHRHIEVRPAILKKPDTLGGLHPLPAASFQDSKGLPTVTTEGKSTVSDIDSKHVQDPSGALDQTRGKQWTLPTLVENDEENGPEKTIEGQTPETQMKSQESKTVQAEQLLNWVNVKNNASKSKEPEIQRIMEQVEHALKDEEIVSPRARAMDTVLVLDTSDSIVENGLDELKTVVHTFIEGIEDNVEMMNLEENLAVIQVGGRAWVRQHLTNDYNSVRDAVDAMTPDSKLMRTGGRTPLFQALLVCLGAIEGKGGVVNVAGCHRVRPRLIVFTDGRPTDEAKEFGPDTQSNVNEVKYSLVQLICEFASKKHKTTPAPIYWVPVGSNPDRLFMGSLAEVSGGKVVEMENVSELCRYYKIQETIGCMYKMVRKHKDMQETEQQVKAVINALAGNLNEDEKKFILEEVRKKQKDPDNEVEDADNFDNIFEDIDLVENGALLPLGTRVRRGPDWKWSNQDADGPGTVIQHRKKKDGWLHVMWDNGTHNAYRYGDDNCYDLVTTESDPRILDNPGKIEIGVQVKRGEDWKSDNDDGNGLGIVIRKRQDSKVKVRWNNGHIGKYRFSMEEGKRELQVYINPEQQVSSQDTESEPMEEEGAEGGSDSAEGKRRIWQWWDRHTQTWRMYSADQQDKLLIAYNQRRDGSGIITRNLRNRRVMFKTKKEKTVDGRGEVFEVKSEVVSELQYVTMLQKEEER